jgi:hypothetical protein
MKKLNPSKRLRKRLTGALKSIESDNPEVTAYGMVARITGCESLNPPLLPGSTPYEVTLRSGHVKTVVRYEGKFYDVEKYVRRANQERDTKLQFPFSLAMTDSEKEEWMKSFREIVDAQASEAANDIRQGTGDRIPRTRIAKTKRFVKSS